jgi:NADH dehydrogenase [ubiquinone] 1 alpha subcomplex assembly factor 6
LRGLLGGTTSRRKGRSPRRGEPSPTAALVRRHDRDRYQTALFAPAAGREALFALYAFNFEIARVRESVRQPMLGLMRLQWWREAIATAYDGGPVRRHVVVAPLTAAIRAAEPTRGHFEHMIAARERDLDDAPPANLAALEDYAGASSGGLLVLALELLGVRDPAAIGAAREVGIAYALAGLLRAIPYLASTGRRMIPADIAERAGLDERGYFARRSSPALAAAAAEIAEAADRHLRAARARRGAIPRAALPALLPALIAGHALARLARAGHDPFAAALARPDPLQSWRLAAAALRGRF